ncbi:asparagine synthase (glutamine-hydrolyzing) [Mycobacterium decipiens]|uniref:asparagine synthase (glutamine-hydrolyzing) n=1 Tax=Mycobacterium decipiens TaxID=1430326 RepID=A0A1X2LUK7_9MYCO|nr:asparagine synthase (glutamine-hydrolyzing) [Mycobacterium decipiens]OSC40649.1 asparagine synthase (glutamine-hydrolyzing) [Mycobacterium decipiens]
MCGITGWVDYHGLGPTADTVLTRMTDTMAPRGPNGAGIWRCDIAGLGHRRLAIIDPDGGAQPMTHNHPSTGNVDLVLTYSGEVYNYRELRVALVERGHSFTTSSDTEVLLKAWAEWGPAAVSRINGMYAFGVWDSRERTLTLVRDRLGVKPLYFRHTESSLVFGSEPKAILTHDARRPEVDEEGIVALMLPLLKIPGRSPYSDIDEVRPGEIATFSARGLVRRRYWTLDEALTCPPRTTSLAEAAHTVRTILDDTVQRQLVADVPLCTLLSGGLDSTAITALANARRHGAPIRSVSIDFSAPVHNSQVNPNVDSEYASAAAQFIGSNHRSIILDGATLANRDTRSACVRSRDLPLGIGDLDMSLYLMCATIKEHSTVALSGESADEVFGGYLWFHRDDAVMADTFPWMSDSPAHGRLHHRIATSFRPELRAKLQLDDYVADQYRTALAELTPTGGGPQEQRMRELTYLGLSRFLPTLLDRKDRLSMAAGIELRVPFCDHRLVEYVAPLAWSLRTGDGQEKSVLRQAVSDIIPRAVAARRKSPYPSVADPDYSAETSRQLADRLAEPDCRLTELFDPRALQRAVQPATAPGALISNVEAELALNFDDWLRTYDPVLAL